MEAKKILQESDKRQKPNLDLQSDVIPVSTGTTSRHKYLEMCERLQNFTAFRVDVNRIDPKTGAPTILQEGEKAEEPKSASSVESRNGIKLLPFRVPMHAMVDTEAKLPINNRRTAAVNGSKDKKKLTSKRISQRSSFMHPTHKRPLDKCVKTSLFKSPVLASKNYGFKHKNRCTKLDTNRVDETLPLIDMDLAENLLLKSVSQTPKSKMLLRHRKPLYLESPATREFCEIERQFQYSAKKSTSILKNVNDIDMLEKYEQGFKDFTLSHSKNMESLHAMKRTDINEILEKEKKDFAKIVQSHTKFMEIIHEQTKNMLKNDKENEPAVPAGTPKSLKLKNCLPHLSDATNIRLIEQLQYHLLQDTPIHK